MILKMSQILKIKKKVNFYNYHKRLEKTKITIYQFLKILKKVLSKNHLIFQDY